MEVTNMNDATKCLLSDVILLNEYVALLNSRGSLSTVLLQMKFKIKHGEALKIINSICADFSNVYKITETLICIEGREGEWDESIKCFKENLKEKDGRKGLQKFKRKI